VNTTEHIVEEYFRHCRNCFTLSDVKVIGGNNRQIDLLAHSVVSGDSYHIEVSVTHARSFMETKSKLKPQFDKKFFGMPKIKPGMSNGTTDAEKGKDYFKQICETYEKSGIDPEKIKRVWVSWVVAEHESDGKFELTHEHEKFNRINIEVLSMRNLIIPSLSDTVGKANYDDEILRTFSLLKQWNTQTPRTRQI
jgi:hypothetical protein